uniref:Uncharacterized protein n=1 Tax=viral metagenome TaxID=1070528 RepID=A0A6C0LHD6_9ZZZZ
MTSIIIVDKSASIKATKVKDLTNDTIYKKCGFRKADGFEMRSRFLIKKFDIDTVEVWARDSGKAGSENKYELPPPIDKDLFFGSIAIVGLDKNKEFCDLTDETWKKVYEHLFGGFDDIENPDSEEEYSEDELESVPAEKKTKNGYLKDGFVVDLDDDESVEELTDDSDVSSSDNDEPDIEAELELSGSELELEEEDEYYYSDED